MLPLPVEKGTMHKRHASVRKPRRCASRHRQPSSQLSVKHSSRWLQPLKRHLTNLPLKGNGTQEPHSRRTKRLTMHCRTERLERRDTALTSRAQHTQTCSFAAHFGFPHLPDLEEMSIRVMEEGPGLVAPLERRGEKLGSARAEDLVGSRAVGKSLGDAACFSIGVVPSRLCLLRLGEP